MIDLRQRRCGVLAHLTSLPGPHGIGDSPCHSVLQFAFGGDRTHEFLLHDDTAHGVVYSGTHDNDTARGWWDTAPAHERHYTERYLACTGDDARWGMVRAACNSVACMAVLPLQDALGLPCTERMNIPDTLGGGNWAWRFSWPMVLLA